MDIKEKVLGLLFIDSMPTDNQIKLIDSIIEVVTAKLLNRLPEGTGTIPTSLNYIVIEVSIIRYNRIGSEGMRSEGVEGHSMTFYDNDFKDFERDIAAWIDAQNEPSQKVVRFL